jgi:hypothetical protein
VDATLRPGVRRAKRGVWGVQEVAQVANNFAPAVHQRARETLPANPQEKTMKHVIAAVLLAFPLPALAQGTPEAAPAKAQPGTAAGMNTGTPVKDPIDMMREDVRNQRADLLAKNLGLTADQAAKFWPIYKKYETERAKLGDARVAAIKDYVASFDTMKDAQAVAMVKAALDRDDKYNKLRRQFIGLFEKALPGTVVLHFAMIDAYLDAVINLQILGQLPMVK